MHALPLDRLFILFVCVLASRMSAQVTADTPSVSATDTGFDIIVIPTTQYAHSDIYYRTPSGRTPHFLATHQLAPDQALDLIVLAKEYATDSNGCATISYELTTQDPAGKAGSRTQAMLASQQKTSPHQVIFPKDVMRFIVASSDPKGKYTLTITARDQVGNRTVTKSLSIEVAPTNDSLPPPLNFDPVQFLMNYHRKPEPRLLVPFLIASAASPLRERPIDGHGAMLGFVAGVLHDNPWLLPQVEQCLEQAPNENTRRVVAYALAYSQRDVKDYGRHLSPKARTALEKAEQEDIPTPSKRPNRGSQLDLLWGEFFATGRFAPIQQLVEIAENYMPYRGKLDAYKRMSPRPDKIPADALKDILLGTALWSLGSNAYQCNRVGDYVAGIAHHFKDASRSQRAIAQAVLAWKPPPQKPAAK